MKIKLFVIIALMIISCCRADIYAETGNKVDSTINPSNLFTRADAEKILGQNSVIKDSTYEIKDNLIRYKCSYMADSTDAKTGKTGIVYFVFEKYTKIVEACDVYYSIREANKDHDGVKVIKDIGDEAYSQVTKTFYFIIVRTRNKIIVMKVNKTTSKTSLDEFMSIARKTTTTAYEQY